MADADDKPLNETPLLHVRRSGRRFPRRGMCASQKGLSGMGLTGQDLKSVEVEVFFPQWFVSYLAQAVHLDQTSKGPNVS
jgi:hypothetical protein